MIQLNPWFLGQAGPGLSQADAKALFGPGVPLIKLPGDPPLQKQKGASMQKALMSALAETRKAFRVQAITMPGTFYGVRGLGLVYSRSKQKGDVHVIPIALFNAASVKFLTEAESRALVTEPPATRPKIALEVIRTELDGGAESSQVEDVEPSTVQQALRYALPVGLGLGAIGAGVALTR